MTFLFQRILANYNVPIFEKLNKALDDKLVLVHGQSAKESFLIDGLGARLPFNDCQVRNYWFFGEKAVWQNCWKPFLLVKNKPAAIIMEASPRILSIYPLFVYCKIRKIPFVLWGHGGSRKRNVADSASMKDSIHRWLIKNSDAYICYSDGIKKALSNFTDERKLFTAHNTLDTDTLLSIRQKLEREGEKSVKNRLGLGKDRYICFIGRLLPGKQVDYLIDVFEMIRQGRDDIGLIIIGDGPDRDALEKYASDKKLKDVLFLGAISDWEESGQYLFISDVMVMPGYVGLSVNHAFCFGLPVVTQTQGNKGPFHSPEIEYLIEGRTGFICANGNKHAMKDAILDVFDRREFYIQSVTSFCKNNLLIDQMVDGMKSAVLYAQANK